MLYIHIFKLQSVDFILKGFMKNRAKCKLCESIIESFHRYDFVTCKCGEIALDGGTDSFRVMATDLNNIIRVDDLGNEVIVTILDKNEESPPSGDTKKLSKEELLGVLNETIKNIDNLPTQAKFSPVSNADFSASLVLLSAIFRAPSNEGIF
jgi:hypothetical protein